MGLLTALYFAQGLPYGFFTQAVPVVLRESGYSLTAISGTGLLFAPWALKFLWAPYIDAYGSRRSWLLWLQCGSAAVALGMAGLDLTGGFGWLFVGIAIINLLSATQDVATDGLAVVRLAPQQRGIGNGVQVGAYRIGMIVGGGALLYLFWLVGWRGLFIAMAILLVLCTIPVWWLPRAEAHAPEPRAVTATSVGRLSVTWWRRLRRPGVLALILLIAGYKFGDSMGSAMVGPFMSDSGLSIPQIALVKGVLSSVGALLGAAVGGVVAYRFGRRAALLIGGVAQTGALLLYLLSALGIGGFGLLVTASLAEHTFGGAATVAVFTVMMDAAQRRHAGADYTLMACAVVVAQGLAGLAAGVVGDALGYPTLFAVSAALSLAGCVAMTRAYQGRHITAALRAE